MFFSDPVVAFANIRRSLKPSGRLVFVCWRPLNQNPWMRAPLEAALPVQPPIAPMQLFDPGERCAVQRLALKPIKDPVVEYPNWSVKRSEAKVKAEPKAVGAFREGGRVVP
jgi:SAM-dependent methyltransferase